MSTELMPHLTFERKAVDYKDADGHTLYKDAYLVHIRQRGSKDEVTKDAAEWIADLKHKAASRNDFDENSVLYTQWSEKASIMFEAFKNGEEAPIEGLLLKDLIAFSPAEVKNCQNSQLFTLEQLASANEIALGFLGPGARGLKMKAQKMIENYATGKAAEENIALRLRLDEQALEIERLRKLVESSLAGAPPMDLQAMIADQLAKAMAALPRGPGRPPKAA